MFLYQLNDLCFKSRNDNDVSLYAIYPTALRNVSIDHFKAYTHCDGYKNVNLFAMASKYIALSVSKIDGRSSYAKQLGYISVNVLLQMLKDNESFKFELMQALNNK